MPEKQTLIVITGPTAVGKTDLCLSLAEHYNVPIINADSRQIFKGMTIGTASPTEEQLNRVRHYFVGCLTLSDYYNASMYEQAVLQLCSTLPHACNSPSEEVPTCPYNPCDTLPCNPRDALPCNPCANGPVAILTGGSMMYIDAVCNGIDDIPTIRDDIREMVKQKLENEGLERLCEQLRKLDPEHYAIVDRKNTRRVVHAIEICLQTGTTYTSFRKRELKPRPFNIIKIALNRPREELYERINQRVDLMMEQGLLEEARQLYPMRNLNALNTVGYKEMFEYIDGACTLDEAIERIKGNTRRYARKQLTWFKRDAAIAWFHPDNITNIIKHIDNILQM